jgi:hypothetical protein
VGTGPGWWERLLFAVMGPAQIGDINGPSTLSEDPSRDLCRKCGQRWDLHTVIRPSNVTLAVCPEPGPEGAPPRSGA